MRIGIDGGCLANRRGFGRFATDGSGHGECGRGHEFVVFVDRPSAGVVEVPNLFGPRSSACARRPAARRRLRAAIGGRHIGDGPGRGACRLDLIYFPATYSFFPVWNVRRVVVTMHDTLALAHPELVFPDVAGADGLDGQGARRRRAGPTGS